MRTLNKLLTCAFLLLCLASCKKDTQSSTQTNQSTPPASPTSFYGILNAYYVKEMNGMFLQYPYCEAYFSTTPISTKNPSTQIQVTSVKLNNVSFKFSNIGRYYYDTTNAITFPSTTWCVNSAGGFPSFTVTVNDPLPGYTGFDSIPLIVNKAQTVIIPIYGVTGADLFKVTLSDGIHVLSKTVAANSNNVTITPADMAILTAGTTNSTIEITCIKNNVQDIAGKPMNFTTNSQSYSLISIQ